MTFCQGGPDDRALVRARIDEILARPEFGHSRNPFVEWLDEKIGEIAEWVADLLGIPEPAVARQVLLVLVGLIGLALVVKIFITLRRRLRALPGSPTTAAGVGSEGARAAGVAALRQAARACADQGDHLGALRLYFRALLLGLSERGALEYRDAWTNRELLERGAPRPEVLPLLAPLVPRLDAQSFGHLAAGPSDVERLAELCDRLLAGTPLAGTPPGTPTRTRGRSPA